jgi:hypothetical protein
MHISETSLVSASNLYNPDRRIIIMKKQILFLLCLLSGLGATAQDPTGIIGINTENPRGVLHIDGATTPATTNPQAGDVSPAQAADDVIVDSQGRIGIGHPSPTARIDIRTSTPGAIRIQDGTEEAGKALVSDADGLAQWKALIWYAELKGGSSIGATSGSTAQIWPPFTFTGSELFPAGVGGVNPAAGTIQVPHTGEYTLTLTGTADTNRTTGEFRSAITLSAGAQSIYLTFTYMMKSVGVLDFGNIYLLSLTAGDVLKLSPYTAGNTLEANVYTNIRLILEYIR